MSSWDTLIKYETSFPVFTILNCTESSVCCWRANEESNATASGNVVDTCSPPMIASPNDVYDGKTYSLYD